MLGGGALNVPIFYFLWGLTYKESVVVSLSTLMGNYLCQVRHFVSFFCSFYLSICPSNILFLLPPYFLSFDMNLPTIAHTHTHTTTHTHAHTQPHTHMHTTTHTTTHTHARTHNHTHNHTQTNTHMHMNTGTDQPYTAPSRIKVSIPDILGCCPHTFTSRFDSINFTKSVFILVIFFIYFTYCSHDYYTYYYYSYYYSYSYINPYSYYNFLVSFFHSFVSLNLTLTFLLNTFIHLFLVFYSILFNSIQFHSIIFNYIIFYSLIFINIDYIPFSYLYLHRLYSFLLSLFI